MRFLKDFSADRQKAWCVHCRGWLAELDVNVDYAPSKSFLMDPRPENLPTVPVCSACNLSFSLDEAYMVASLSCALSGTTDPSEQMIPSAARILAKSPSLRQQIDRSCSYTTIGGKRRTVWNPDLKRIERVVVKKARCHAFFEMGEPMMDEPVSARIVPREYLKDAERADFEKSKIPVYIRRSAAA
jgi:hypothetical protein